MEKSSQVTLNNNINIDYHCSQTYIATTELDGIGFVVTCNVNCIIIIKLFISNQTDDLIYYKCTM